MEETLQFKGINYISSKRAAELVGYTKDYVGQLCRAGKLEARLVGRSWYVSEPSILQHKLTVHYTLHQPIKQRQPRTETVVVRADEETEEVPMHILQARETEIEESSRATHVDVQVRVATKAGVRRQRSMLANTDVRYENSEPLFYEDDRPVNPAPVRMTRFQDVPIVSPVQTRSTVVRYAEPVRQNVARPVVRGAQGPVDGVMPSGERPGQRSSRRAERVSYDAQPKTRPPARRPKASSSARGSKAVPVLGGILALLILALVYYVRELGILAF